MKKYICYLIILSILICMLCSCDKNEEESIANPMNSEQVENIDGNSQDANTDSIQNAQSDKQNNTSGKEQDAGSIESSLEALPITVKSEVVDFEGVPLSENLASSTFVISASLEDYVDGFNVDKYIIFKGIKKQDSTQIITTDGNVVFNWYSETPIYVEQAYYGDIKDGDTIIFRELAAVIEKNGEKRLYCDESVKPIKKNTEYIFFFAKHKDATKEKGLPMYSYIAMSQSIHEITSEVTTAKTADELYGGKKNLSSDVFKKYYFEKDKLDLRIDLAKELDSLLKSKINGYEGLINKSKFQEIKLTDKEIQTYQEIIDRYKDIKLSIKGYKGDLMELIPKLEKSDSELMNRIIERYGIKA